MTDILWRIMNIVERVRTASVLSEAMTVLFGVLAVFGIINCILGYRLLRFWMMLFGFVLGGALGFVAVYTYGAGESYIYLAAMIGLGIVLALVAFLIYKVGIFVIGAGLGLVLSIYIIHPTTSFTFFLCILIGGGLGMAAMRWAREIIIVGTSLLGGVLSGVSVAKLGTLEQIPYGIAMSVGFALLGMLIQFAINKVDEDEEEPEERKPAKRKPLVDESFEDDHKLDYDMDYETDYDDKEEVPVIKRGKKVDYEKALEQELDREIQKGRF